MLCCSTDRSPLRPDINSKNGSFPVERAEQHSGLAWGAWATASNSTVSTCRKGQLGSYPLELAPLKPFLLLPKGLIQVPLSRQDGKTVLQYFHAKSHLTLSPANCKLTSFSGIKALGPLVNGGETWTLFSCRRVIQFNQFEE